MSEFNLNFNDFEKKFNDIIKVKIPELTEKGMGRAMLDLLNDCIMESPTVPLKEGWLRGSGSIFVQNKLVSTSEGMPGAKAGKALKSFSEQISFGEYSGIVGFNTPYASRMHEGIGFNFTEPSSGAKFLESKLSRKREHYMQVIADTIKENKNA